MGSLLWPLWPWLSLRPMLGDTTDAGTDTAMDAGTDTDMARGPLMLTPAPTLGVTDMAAHTDTATDTGTDTDMARGPLMPSLLLLLRPSLRLRPMPTTDTALVSMATTLMATDSPTPVTDTDTIMARGPLMPMPTTDTDTAAHTMADTARGLLMPSQRPGDTMAAHTDTVTDTGTDTLMASKLPPTWSPATAPSQ